MTDNDTNLSPKEKKLKNVLDILRKDIILALDDGKGAHLELDCKGENLTQKLTITKQTKL
jgi:hypothetical protein